MSARPLDLSTIDPPIWHVSAAESVFGPYTLGQMRTFIAENRVAADTQVSKRAGGPFQSAQDVAELAEIFDPTLARVIQADDERPSDSKAGPINVVIFVKLTGVRAEALKRNLNGLGQYTEAAPGMFVLRTRSSLQKVRQRVEIVVSTEDQVVLVDATHGRLGFIHLGPETDVRVRSVWNADV